MRGEITEIRATIKVGELPIGVADVTMSLLKLLIVAKNLVGIIRLSLVASADLGNN